MNLTDDDVREIVKLLNASPYDELTVETRGFKLQLRRAGHGWTQARETAKPAASPAAAAAQSGGAGETVAPGLTPIVTPLVGTFYRAPRPGAEPFVQVGAKVKEDTVVAIVETMKLMNSVHAGARGTIVEIRAQNAEFVEHGRVLMTLKPDA